MNTALEDFDTDDNALNTTLNHDAQGNQLEVALDGFEGPIDVLLELAKTQKVDLLQISVVKLARQYLEFIDRAQELNLEIAGDYLVMAAWLTYLKSRLLLPEDPEPEEELSSEELAARLAFQLKRLQAMRDVGSALLEGSVLHERAFPRGQQDGIVVTTQTEFDLKLHDLLHAYARLWRVQNVKTYTPKKRWIFKIEDALQRLTTMLGLAKDWTELKDFMPLDEITDYVVRKSAVASTFGACLELTKQGQMDIQQDKAFGPLMARQAEHK